MQEPDDGISTATCEVLKKLKCDGHFDHLTDKLVDRLKKNGELRNYIISLVEQSFVLNKPGAETMSPRQLYDAIIDEIKNPVLEKISEATWKVLDSKDELGKEITETCERACLQTSNKKRKAPPSPENCSSDSLNSFEWEPIEPPGFSRSMGQQFGGFELQQKCSRSFDQQFVDGGGQQHDDREDNESMGLSLSVGKEMSEPPGLHVAIDQRLFHRDPEGYSNDNKVMESLGLAHVKNHHLSFGGPNSYDPVLSYRKNHSGRGRGGNSTKIWRGNNPTKLH